MMPLRGGLAPLTLPSNAPIPAFVPSDIAGLQLWFKPESLAGYADGATITSWADSSGNARHAVSTANPSPVCKTSILNGYRVARFATTGFCNLAHSAFTLTNATYFVVYNKASTTSNAQIMTGSDTVYAYLQYNTAWYIGVNSATYALTQNTWAIRCARNTLTGNSERFSNGVAGATSTQANTSYKYIGLLGFLGPAGDIAEIIVYNSALSDINRTKVDTYLAAKYGITLA